MQKKFFYLPIFSGGLRQWRGIEWNVSEPGRPCQVPNKGYLLTSWKGKEVEMPGRESDMLIVVSNEGNTCGAKGHALLCRV
jgi:hypothetical protein